MAESMIAGLLRMELVAPDKIAASHPRLERRSELDGKYKIQTFENNADAVKAVGNDKSIVVLCVKPQRIKGVLDELSSVVQPENPIILIIAGATIEIISKTLENRLIVRAMPNTPSQIGQGMTAWTSTAEVDEVKTGAGSSVTDGVGQRNFCRERKYD